MAMDIGTLIKDRENFAEKFDQALKDAIKTTLATKKNLKDTETNMV